MNGATQDDQVQTHTSLRADQRLTRKPEEVAQLLGIGRNGVYDLIRRGDLRSIAVGRKLLIPLTAIEEFLTGSQGSIR
ncbi:helix-turn-helix domain-containing protein [Deinococcus taklimakanensis]|uniref:Helix-turn-helix domain-containing protein n=1 Tax=Deinococcus taklimakanensis TaxID=536443 RepID=A0ABW5P0A4_9DEIO